MTRPPDAAAGGWVDVTAPLDEHLPLFPGDSGLVRRHAQHLRDGHPVTETNVALGVHCGTHVDAPSHHILDAPDVDALPLEAFLGPAFVVDATGRDVVTADLVATVPAAAERVLFRTDNSERRLLRTPQFDTSFVALDVHAAQALAARPGLRLVGVDYLSVQLYGGDDETHRVLQRRLVAILEGLDLGPVTPGWHELLALPMALPGAEAAPVRALLRPLADAPPYDEGNTR